MLFSATEFVLVFFPATLFSVWLARHLQSRDLLVLFLVAASLVYYMYWNPIDIVFVGVTIVLNYAICRAERIPTRAKIWLTVGINISYLLAFKIFLSTGVGGLGGPDAGGLFGSLGLPLGISFITFQQVTFVVDASENKDRETSFRDYVFFVLFFPQLVSGPILKHSLIIPQTKRASILRFSWRYFAVGIGYFGIGFAKKVMIADVLTASNTQVFAATAHLAAAEAWMNAFMYSARIYFDFSAYADMAVGLSYMLGFQVPRNFNAPYRTTNIADFWRRWHITLYHFFRDYVFKRLLRLSAFRASPGAAVLVVMLLSGLWHGFGFGFLAWAVGHAVLMLLYRNFRNVAPLRAMRAAGGARAVAYRWLCIGAMFLVVTLLWIPFATNDIGQTLAYFQRMFDTSTWGQLSGFAYVDRNDLFMLLVGLAVIFLMPTSHQICLGHRKTWIPVAFGIVMFIVALPVMLQRTGVQVPFLYFAF